MEINNGGGRKKLIFMRKLLNYYKRHTDLILGSLGVSAFLLLWQWAGSTRAVNPLFISYPTEIFSSAYDLFSSGFIYKHLWISGQEFFIGYTAAVVVGIAIGVLVGWYKLAYSLLNPFISVFYTTPKIVLLPLIILWLGIGLESKVLLVFMSALFSVLINTMIGMKSVDNDLIKVARSFGANDLQLFRTVVLPYSMPFILAGLRLAVGRALMGIIIAEFYGAQGGIGYLLTLYGATFQTDRLMVMILIIVIVGVSLTELIHLFEKKFESWRPIRD